MPYLTPTEPAGWIQENYLPKVQDTSLKMSSHFSGFPCLATARRRLE